MSARAEAWAWSVIRAGTLGTRYLHDERHLMALARVADDDGYIPQMFKALGKAALAWGARPSRFRFEDAGLIREGWEMDDDFDRDCRLLIPADFVAPVRP